MIEFNDSYKEVKHLDILKEYLLHDNNWCKSRLNPLDMALSVRNSLEFTEVLISSSQITSKISDRFSDGIAQRLFLMKQYVGPMISSTPSEE